MNFLPCHTQGAREDQRPLGTWLVEKLTFLAVKFCGYFKINLLAK